MTFKRNKTIIGLFWENVNLILKKSSLNGVDWISYVYIRIQYAELKMPEFLPFIGKLEKDEIVDVNYAATQLIDTDIPKLEACISPTIDTDEAKPEKLETFQLSCFTLEKLSPSELFRFGSIFNRRRDIRYYPEVFFVNSIYVF